MTATESAETLTMYQMVFLTAFFAAALPFGWVTPTLADWGALAANGLANALGQYLWTRALHLAPTSAVVPFNYFSLVWAIILGLLVWGDVPSATLLVGSAVVVGPRASRPQRPLHRLQGYGHVRVCPETLAGIAKLSQHEAN